MFHFVYTKSMQFTFNLIPLLNLENILYHHMTNESVMSFLINLLDVYRDYTDKPNSKSHHQREQAFFVQLKTFVPGNDMT